MASACKKCKTYQQTENPPNFGISFKKVESPNEFMLE